jgi:hypothetical protein
MEICSLRESVNQCRVKKSFIAGILKDGKEIPRWLGTKNSQVWHGQDLGQGEGGKVGDKAKAESRTS